MTDRLPVVETFHSLQLNFIYTFVTTLASSVSDIVNTLEQAVTSQERVHIPSPVIEMMLIVDSVHVLQTAWDRVGQVDIQPSPPGEHPDGLQGKTTLEMFSKYPGSD